MGEDRCQIHTGNGIISMLQYEEWENIASALRYLGTSVQRALQLIGAGAT